MYTLRGLAGQLFMRLCHLLPLKDKAVFTSFYGKSCSDSPKAIYDEMRKKYGDSIEYVWIMADGSAQVEGARVVRDFTLRSVYEHATAKLWIDNCRKREWMIKRKGQYYVMTWHGDNCLKKIEKDAESKLDKRYVKCAKRDSQLADLMLSGSRFRTENYKSAFWYDGAILELGCPKTDIFYKPHAPYIKKVKEAYGLSEETKIAVYMPTFRATADITCYDIDNERLLAQLEASWGGKWVILVRLHPNIMDKCSSLSYNDRIKNATMYGEANELLMACDLLITDYSSCMFDAIEARKRVLLYASDMDTYLDDRGFYFRMDELPFPLAQNNDELMQCIADFDEKAYQLKNNAFIERLGICNSGNSAEKVTEYIYKKVWSDRK